MKPFTRTEWLELSKKLKDTESDAVELTANLIVIRIQVMLLTYPELYLSPALLYTIACETPYLMSRTAHDIVDYSDLVCGKLNALGFKAWVQISRGFNCTNVPKCLHVSVAIS